MVTDTLVKTLIDDLLDPDGRGLDATHLAGATQDMKGRVRSMPRYLGMGMTALTALFASTGYLGLPKHLRVKRLARWRTSVISLRRDFVEFWEKMGTFTYYSRVEKAEH